MSKLGVRETKQGPSGLLLERECVIDWGGRRSQLRLIASYTTTTYGSRVYMLSCAVLPGDIQLSGWLTGLRILIIIIIYINLRRLDWTLFKNCIFSETELLFCSPNMKKVIIAALMDNDDQLTEMIGNVPLLLETGKDMSDIHHRLLFFLIRRKR